jgi:hypothetical protein
MNKITIITGPQGVGKTQKAFSLCEGKRYFHTKYTTLYEALKSMPIDTEVLILDELDSYHEISDIFSLKKMFVRRNYGKFPIEIKIPDLIITSYLFFGFRLFLKNKNVELIDLTNSKLLK